MNIPTLNTKKPNFKSIDDVLDIDLVKAMQLKRAQREKREKKAKNKISTGVKILAVATTVYITSLIIVTNS